jgi:hypothetical protein
MEFGSTGEPIAIPKNYFWKGVEIDFDSGTVTALGRKFGQVANSDAIRPGIPI